MVEQTPKHRADVPVRIGPIHGYMPRHCSGQPAAGNECLHQHADDRRCGCGQVILGPDIQSIVTSVRPLRQGCTIPTRHADDGCHVVSASSRAVTKL